jgi:hypothetical protein
MRNTWMVIAALLLSAGTLPAQTQPSAAEQMLNQMLQPASTQPAPSTRPEPTPALQPQGFVAKPAGPQILREGSDVIARSGHLVKVADNPYPQFVFDPRPNEPPLAPMYVMPNLQLMSMEDAGSATRQNLTFTVSGMVTEYKAKNYILLREGPDEISQQMSQQMPQQMPSPSKTLTKVRGPMSADQMLKAMLSADTRSDNPIPRAIPLQTDLTSGPGAVPADAPSLTVLPEPSQIIDRVCRLDPNTDSNERELTLDSDGAALQDPPLLILPNLKLADLESAAKTNRDMRYRVTGMITEYRGRNYILLQKVVVIADIDRQF